MRLFQPRFVVLAILPALLGSCVVSKKKYEELEFAKRRSDAKVRVLTQENQTKDEQISDLNGKLDHTLAEYNDVKNSMSESNAMKTSEIDALSTELMGLASDTTQLKEKLVETIGQLDAAKRKNDSRQELIDQLQIKVQQLQADSTQLAKDLNNVQVESNWEKKKMESAKSKLDDQIKKKEEEIATLKKELEEYQGKASWLRKVNAKNEEEIERLSNQLKLYKKELDKALSKSK